MGTDHSVTNIRIFEYIRIFSATNIRSYHIRILFLIRIYSDIRSYCFFQYEYIRIFVRIKILYSSHYVMVKYFPHIYFILKSFSSVWKNNSGFDLQPPTPLLPFLTFLDKTDVFHIGSLNKVAHRTCKSVFLNPLKILNKI